MEIVKLNDVDYQLVNESGTVILRGTYDECWDQFAMYSIEHEDEDYARYLTLSGF